MATKKDILALPQGAKFYRVDLHLHSHGASHDIKDKSVTPEAIVAAAIAENLDVIALTDHNEISNVEAAINAAKGKNLLVIPGVELSTPQGHLLAYLPTFTALSSFHGRLSFGDRGTEKSHCKTAMYECLEELSKLGGIAILAHVDAEDGFEARTPGGATPHRQDILCHPALVGIELLSLMSTISYSANDPDANRALLGAERIKRLGLGQLQFLARILNSDAHTVKRVGRNSKGQSKVSRVKMDKPSFDALRIALEDADARVRIEEEIPPSVPYLLGFAAEGGFLDGFKIRFSSNLNCIIGGRGTGKSTTFEGIRCLIAGCVPGDSVDSEIWPDNLHMYWQDQAGQQHPLHRPLHGNVSHVDDPADGPTTFDIESYAQGETTRISQEAKTDPTALLKYLDRFTNTGQLEEDETEAQDELLRLRSAIEEAEKQALQAPDIDRDLKTTQGQLSALEAANAKEVIKLQRDLEQERTIRGQISDKLSEIHEDLDFMDPSEELEEIEALAEAADLTVGADEFKGITAKTRAYKTAAQHIAKQTAKDFELFKKDVDADLAAWKAKESTAEQEIEKKKKELAAKGIPMDLAFIRKLTADEARLKKELRAAKAWEPQLKQLRRDYGAASKTRWAARDRIAMARVGYGKIATENLKLTLTDLTVSLKFLESAYSPEAEEQIKNAMGWRTSQVPRASLLISQLSMPKLIEALEKGDSRAIASVKTQAGTPAFTASEVKSILEKLSEPSIRFALERASVFDVPKITVTGMVTKPDGTTQAVIKDFTKLSLGQQQSVLLALMLSSKSNAPLIIDQPEDHLDSEFIYRTLVPVLRQAKERRQIIIVTHNANIAVLGDAEQIIVLKSTSDKSSIAASGSIDDPATKELTCAVLEGAREAFSRRARIYGPTP